MGRFLLEFLRLDPARIGGININQSLMLLVALGSAAFLYWRHRTKRTETSESQAV
jgi:prolipoprotein diacylglyceryltransferase